MPAWGCELSIRSLLFQGKASRLKKASANQEMWYFDFSWIPDSDPEGFFGKPKDIFIYLPSTVVARPSPRHRGAGAHDASDTTTTTNTIYNTHL